MVDITVDDSDQDWAVPGIYEVVPGVYRIPLPLPTDVLRAVNVYAVADREDLVLIDSGWAIAEARQALVAGLAGLDRGLGDVRRFLVTHVHQDHYTQAIALRREFGMEVALGKGEQPTLEVLSSGAAPQLEYGYLGLLRAAGADDLLARLSLTDTTVGRYPVTWEAPDEWLSDRSSTLLGERELLAVATPGHTRGHLIYLEQAARLLFAGDHILPHITTTIGLESAPADFPLRDYLNSLRLVRAMPDMRLLPAHGPVTASAHQRIDLLLEHHDHRLRKIGLLVEQGASTAFEVASRMTWARHARRLDELDPVNEMLAVVETLNHLDVLMLQGRVRRTMLERTRHYYAD